MQDQIMALLRLTVQDPRAAAAGLMANERARANAMSLGIVVVILGVLAAFVQSLILPMSADGLVVGLLENPVLYAIIQFMLLMISVIAAHVVGRMFGGRGKFNQALLIIVWLQFFVLVVQFVIIPAILISSSLYNMLNVVVLVYSTWLMVNFIAELHGFRSLLRVLGGIVGVSFLAAFLLLLFQGLLGIKIEGI
jgi:hypothetical protein